jgi:EpsI family protein
MIEAQSPRRSELPSAGRILAAAPVAASLLIFAAGFVIGLQELWPQLHRQWTAVNHYEHGYLMLAMAGWLAWRSWRTDPPGRLQPDWAWLLPFAVVLSVLLLMELVFLDVPRLYVLPLLLVTGFGLVFGREVARHLAGPAMLMYFTLPLWVGLTPYLQALTTAVNTFLLSLFSIPVYIEGNFVYLPAGAFEIAEGCSGLKFLIVGMSLGAFYGLAFLHTWRARILLFAIAVGVTLLSNWLRVFIIIVAGHLTDMQHYLVAESHHTFGWVLFAIMLSLVLLCASWIELRSKPREPSDTAVSARHNHPSPSRPLAMPAAATLCAGLLLVPGVFHSVGAGAAQEFAVLPGETPDGAAQRAPALPWQPVFRDGHVDRAAYATGERNIDVYRALYARQTRDARVIRYGHSFTGKSWRPIGRHIREVQLGADSYKVIEYQGYAGGQLALIWAWYEVGGRPATSSLGVKLLEVAALAQGRRDAAAVAIASRCVPSCDSAADDMQSFLQANAGWLGGASAGSGAR